MMPRGESAGLNVTNGDRESSSYRETFEFTPGRKTMVSVGIFFILAIVAGVLAFGGIGDVGVGIARLLFVVFLVLLLTSVLAVGFARDSWSDRRGEGGKPGRVQ